MVDTHTHTHITCSIPLNNNKNNNTLFVIIGLYYLREVGTSCLNLETSMTLDFRPFFLLRMYRFLFISIVCKKKQHTESSYKYPSLIMKMSKFCIWKKKEIQNLL